MGSLSFAQSYSQIKESNQRRDLLLRKENLEELTTAKLFLINGNIKKAKRKLEKTKVIRPEILAIKNRYLSIIAFIEGNYQKSNKYLFQEVYETPKFYGETCLQKTLNFYALQDIPNFISEYNKCLPFIQESAPNNLLWLDNLIALSTKNQQAIEGNSIKSIQPYKNDLESILIWLKLGLYLNKEQTILKEIGKAPGEYFESKRFRELLGLIYIRSGDKKTGFEFIEDLNTANSENIKGNMKLEKNKTELAYGHFQIALSHKENSRNAIERAIPLAWSLGKFKDGLKLVKKIRGFSSETYEIKGKKEALKAAFLTRMEKPSLVEKILYDTEKLFKGRLPLELEQLKAFNSIILKNKNQAEIYHDKTCKRWDGLGCWLLLQLNHWDDFFSTIHRSEEIHNFKDWSINDLKSSATYQPIQEEILIDQRDIEELDLLEN